MSLRARVLLGMGLVSVVLVVLAVTVTRTIEANLIHQVDQQLSRSADQFGDADDRPGSRHRPLPGQSGDGDDDAVYERPSPLYVAAIDPSSGSVATLATPDTTSSDPGAPSVDLDRAERHVGGAPFTVGAEGSDLRYRAVVAEDRRTGLLLLYALPLEDVDDTMAGLIRLEVAASAVVLGALGLVTFWVLRLGVRPLRTMTATALDIGRGDLSQRVPEATPGTEAGDLGIALNQMLGRIESAFDERGRAQDRLRQFVADASHELRTPITTIRGYAELYRMGGLQSDDELAEAMRRTEQEAVRMGGLVQDLLDLARLDQGRPLAHDEVDLAVLAADAVADARAVDPARPVDLAAPGPVVVCGDEPKLRQVLANLLGNARVHTPPGTPIHVVVEQGAGQAIVAVRDEGPGMPDEVAARAFERFYRADPARARRTGGSGLGLSIVSGVVAAHHGTVVLETTPGAGTTARVTLPAAT